MLRAGIVGLPNVGKSTCHDVERRARKDRGENTRIENSGTT